MCVVCRSACATSALSLGLRVLCVGLRVLRVCCVWPWSTTLYLITNSDKPLIIGREDADFLVKLAGRSVNDI